MRLKACAHLRVELSASHSRNVLHDAQWKTSKPPRTLNTAYQLPLEGYGSLEELWNISWFADLTLQVRRCFAGEDNYIRIHLIVNCNSLCVHRKTDRIWFAASGSRTPCVELRTMSTPANQLLAIGS
ncbi:hypothetical protein AVEN_194406-1 [Araneus ventricosus]|uniref:Uncharacterized protein n=1 Tax=Araneus ventricosus TaxID=182803 RepID=A0A4Y2A8A6_ARAVE|nr:hypothetical protein AVEN_194406-1 [Araneus ventricosus]